MEQYGGMRQRRQRQEEAPSTFSAVSETLKTFDAYPKMLEDFKEKTGSGAAVSVFACLLNIILTISALRAYLTPTTTDHLYVDTTRAERIRINVNITFPSMPCSGLK